VVLVLAKASSLPQSSAIATPQYIRAYHEISLMGRTDQLGDELGYRPRFMVIGGEPASVLLEVAEGHRIIPDICGKKRVRSLPETRQGLDQALKSFYRTDLSQSPLVPLGCSRSSRTGASRSRR
jgi:hypothetical protein